MNDKFFDVKKEKQDRIINASLKMFALNGYRHASKPVLLLTRTSTRATLAVAAITRLRRGMADVPVRPAPTSIRPCIVPICRS